MRHRQDEVHLKPEPPRGDLDTQLREAIQRLVEAEAAVEALVSNYADAVLDPASGRVIQLRPAEERLRRPTEVLVVGRRELEAVATMAAGLRTAQTPAEMPPIVLDVLLSLFNVSQAALALRDPTSDKTVIELACGKWADLTGHHLPPGGGVCGHVIATGQPFLSPDLRHEPFGASLGLVPGLKSAAAAPLINQGQAIGALVIASERTMSDDHVHLLMAIADMAANAVHRATLHEQTDQRLRRLLALHQIDLAISSSLDIHVTLNVLLDNVVTQLAVDAADVLLFNPYSQKLEYAAGRGFRTNALQHTCLGVGEGYAGRAALEPRIVNIPDLRPPPTDFVRSPLIAQEAFIAYYAVPLIAKGQVEGVLEVFHRAPLDANQDWMGFLQTLADQAAIAIENAQLFEGLQRSNVELALAYDATIEGWSRALDLRDSETEGHTQRVTEMTVELARAISMSEADLVHVRRGALLHDIGKMGIPDSLLHKVSPLTDGEWEIMHRHPVYAYELLSPIAFLGPALDIPYCHHEKWDGTGYPRGLKGEEIPLAARIFAVVDVWDALRSERPYRPVWPEEQVREYVAQQAGAHFDPQAVEAFFRELGTMRGGV